jgi:hypothetical protein
MHYGNNQLYQVNNLKLIIIKKIMILKKMIFVFRNLKHKIILYIKLQKSL